MKLKFKKRVKKINYATNEVLLLLSNDFVFYNNFYKIVKNQKLKDEEKNIEIGKLINKVKDNIIMLINGTITPQVHNKKLVNNLGIGCIIYNIINEIDFNVIIDYFIKEKEELLSFEEV